MSSHYFRKNAIAAAVFFAVAISCMIVFTGKEHTYQLSIIAIFQNEDRFLKEWINFHRLMGVEHFYLFNNLSTDRYLEVLQPFIDAGIVELHDWPYKSQPNSFSDWIAIQSAAYRKGMELARGNSKWVALLDTDEFLFPAEKNNLTDFLQDYGNCAGILVNWQMFGTSGVKRLAEDQFLIEEMTYQAPLEWKDHEFCKSIVRPEHVRYCVDPHSAVYFPWIYSVDPDNHVFPWKFHRSHPVKVDKIRINHYWGRDEDFFQERKLPRRANWGESCGVHQEYIDRMNNLNKIKNVDIKRFVEPLRQLSLEKESNA